jgi:hypothetical protein
VVIVGVETAALLSLRAALADEGVCVVGAPSAVTAGAALGVLAPDVVVVAGPSIESDPEDVAAAIRSRPGAPPILGVVLGRARRPDGAHFDRVVERPSAAELAEAVREVMRGRPPKARIAPARWRALAQTQAEISARAAS